MSSVQGVAAPCAMFTHQLEIDMAMKTNTPWGLADDVEVIAPGVTWYATPSHGGLHLSRELQARMPDYMHGGQFVEPQWGKCWYEEDCEWCLPVVALPDVAWPQTMRDRATSFLRHWHPAKYARFYNITPELGSDLERDIVNNAVWGIEQ